MAVSNETVKQLYPGNGSQDNFAIPCQFIPASASEQIKVFLVDVDGVSTAQTEGALQDYVLSPAYNPITNPSGPSEVVFNTPPASDVLVLITRELPLRQLVSYINSGKFIAKTHEDGMDRLVFMMQQVAEKLKRIPVLNILDESVINMEVPKAIPLGLLATNLTGDGFQWIDASSLIAGTGLGLPVGGALGDVLGKLTGTDYDVGWLNFGYDGYSSRFNEAFATANLKETLDKIIEISYLGPQVSLAASGSGTIREKGDPVTAVTLTATITKRSDPISEVRFYKGATLIHTESSPNPNGGVETYNWTGSFDDNESFSVQVDDDGSTGGPTTASSTQNFTFVYPYYVGAAAPAETAANVALMTKRLISSTTSRTETITAASGEVFYFAYPASYGALVSILDVNNFETFPDWTLRTENITGLDGNPVSYRIYEFNNPVTAGSYQFTFKRS